MDRAGKEKKQVQDMQISKNEGLRWFTAQFDLWKSNVGFVTVPADANPMPSRVAVVPRLFRGRRRRGVHRRILVRIACAPVQFVEGGNGLVDHVNL